MSPGHWVARSRTSISPKSASGSMTEPPKIHSSVSCGHFENAWRHPLPFCQIVTDDIGNRVRLASARRTLHHDPARVFEPVDDLHLLCIERFREIQFVLIHRPEALGALAVRRFTVK